MDHVGGLIFIKLILMEEFQKGMKNGVVKILNALLFIKNLLVIMLQLTIEAFTC